MTRLDDPPLLRLVVRATCATHRELAALLELPPATISVLAAGRRTERFSLNQLLAMRRRLSEQDDALDRAVAEVELQIRKGLRDGF